MRVIFYDEGSCDALRVDELAEEVQRVSGLVVEVRGEFVSEKRGTPYQFRTDEIGMVSLFFAKARVVDPLSRVQPEREPTPVEVAAERRALETPGRTSVGILYDGGAVQCLLGSMLPESALDDCHIAITGRLLGTYMADDRRWHAHTVLLGEPNIISTAGLVQAPARPREYYQGQAMATTRLVPREVVEAELQRRLANRMLLPDDPRLTQAAIGCALQAIAFHLTGEAFCEVPTCRLYNARRQEELIRSQCSPEAALCPKHEAFFRQLREAANE
ncbi:MAG: hypothetical protein FJX75_14545 [Armatimonadetes bacterium]|nr:hypothetical protein [Armatimonadota bacterium]